jgi:hypothetical protein
MCCLSFPDSGAGLPSSYCATSCPSGGSYACSNSDPGTCPPIEAGSWQCMPLPGTTSASTMALGQCTWSDAGAPTGEGGADSSVDTGVADAGGQ